MNWVDPILVTIAMIALYFVSRHEENQRTRWCKLIASVPLLFMVARMMTMVVEPGAFESAAPGIRGILSVTILAFVWSGTGADRAAKGFCDFLLYGHGSRSAGHVPDYRDAREKALDGEFDEAIKLCQWELSKQPDNYEGVILLATIYMNSNRPKLALEQLERLLNGPHLSDKQHREALQAKTECLNTIH